MNEVSVKINFCEVIVTSYNYKMKCYQPVTVQEYHLMRFLIWNWTLFINIIDVQWTH